MPSAAGLRLEMRQKKAGHRDALVDCNPREKDTAGRGLGARKMLQTCRSATLSEAGRTINAREEAMIIQFQTGLPAMWRA
jgi:hypothetical protein